MLFGWLDGLATSVLSQFRCTRAESAFSAAVDFVSHTPAQPRPLSSSCLLQASCGRRSHNCSHQWATFCSSLFCRASSTDFARKMGCAQSRVAKTYSEDQTQVTRPAEELSRQGSAGFMGWMRQTSQQFGESCLHSSCVTTHRVNVDYDSV